MKEIKNIGAQFIVNTLIMLVELLTKICLIFQRKEKSSKFSLNEGEDELTHYGQSLSEIEKFDDPVVSDDDEDEDEGRINGI